MESDVDEPMDLNELQGPESLWDWVVEAARDSIVSIWEKSWPWLTYGGVVALMVAAVRYGS